MTEINRTEHFNSYPYEKSLQEALQGVGKAIRREKNKTVTKLVKDEQKHPSLKNRVENEFHHTIFPEKES